MSDGSTIQKMLWGGEVKEADLFENESPNARPWARNQFRPAIQARRLGIPDAQRQGFSRQICRIYAVQRRGSAALRC